MIPLELYVFFYANSGLDVLFFSSILASTWLKFRIAESLAMRLT